MFLCIYLFLVFRFYPVLCLFCFGLYLFFCFVRGERFFIYLFYYCFSAYSRPFSFLYYIVHCSCPHVTLFVLLYLSKLFINTNKETVGKKQPNNVIIQSKVK